VKFRRFTELSKWQRGLLKLFGGPSCFMFQLPTPGAPTYRVIPQRNQRILGSTQKMGAPLRKRPAKKIAKGKIRN
jgi:hypothetical protein